MGQESITKTNRAEKDRKAQSYTRSDMCLYQLHLRFGECGVGLQAVTASSRISCDSAKHQYAEDTNKPHNSHYSRTTAYDKAGLHAQESGHMWTLHRSMLTVIHLIDTY